jgi:MOB kinase activator 1
MGGRIATNRGNVGVPFPRNFRDIVKTITRRLFRIYAHLYSNHFDQICALGIEGKR